MLDRPRWTRHGQGLALLFATLFLALSLVGYDPADAPGWAVWRAQPVPPHNPCGPVGAALAHALAQSVGWGAWLVIWGLLVLAGLIFRQRTVTEPWAKLAGFALWLAATAALVHTFAPALQPSPPVGSGGFVGGFASALLGTQFGPVGRLLILGAVALTGLALCHETVIGWPIRELLRGSGVYHRLRRPKVTEPTVAAAAPWPARTPIEGPARTPPALERSALPRLLSSASMVPGLSPEVRRIEAQPPAPIPHDGSYASPPRELLDPPAPFAIHEHEAKIQERALLLEKTLREHGCVVRVVQIDTGPVVTQFEVELEAGLRVSKVAGLSNDLAIALAVPSVRIVAPIPGKTTVGIEVPNDRRAIVKLVEVISGLSERLNKLRIPLFLGKDVKGQALAFDLADMPHLLIAGRTGTGKSVCLNAMILSILMTRRPDEVKLILFDPKMVELSQFRRIPHLMHPPVTDMKKAESILSWACDKMDERYAILARAGVRNLQAYNALGPDEIFARLAPESDEERDRIPTYMPYIVIIADEFADLIMQSPKEVESYIVRLAQKARAVGMHLIVATQKPTVDVITGLIKGNLPARIAFQVASRGDSRVVLDEMGADKLLGNGDMLFLIPGTSHIVRAQGTYISDGEVNRICAYLEQYPVEFSKELTQLNVSGKVGKDGQSALKDRDEMYEAAIEVVIREQRGSTSLLQRALGIGYGRAARLIDYMAEDGIVGEFKSGSAREVLYSWDEWESFKNGSDDANGAAA
jgi:S-DNA-T family DNA segregation ATPase FtsK/SpoIIIE